MAGLTATTAPASARPTRGRIALVTLGVSGVGGVIFSWSVAQHSLIGARWGMLELIGGWVVPWLVGAWAARKAPAKAGLVLIGLAAVAMRFAAATGTTPSISDDLYRYSWDAHVQFAGIDPYRYAPDAPQLVKLRNTGYWPTPKRCKHIRETPGCTVINRPDVRTIYPAVAEGWFDLVHLFNPGDAGSRPWQIAGGLVDDATIVLVVVALRDRRRDPREVAWYALSPLPVIEFAGNGHVDGFALLLMVGSLVALARNRRALAGVLVGMAIMVKLYPALALAAFWRKGKFRMAIAAVVTCVVTEAPHVIVVGRKVLGYLPGYLQEEHYESGGRFLLLNLLDIHGHAALRVALVVMVLAALAVAWSRLEPAAGLAVLLGVLILIATPVQPWYAVVAGAIGVIAGVPALLALALAAEPYYATVILPERHQVGIGRAAYGGAALVVAIGLLWRWRQSRSTRSARSAPLTPAEDGIIYRHGGDSGTGQ